MNIVTDREAGSIDASGAECTTRQFFDLTESVCNLLISGDIAMLHKLAKYGSSGCFGKRTRYKWYPLHVAVLTEDPKLVQFILDRPSVDVNVHDGNDVEMNSSIDGIMCLLFCKTPHRQGTKGATPLHYACMIANEEIIKMLADAGADILARDQRDRRPSDYFPVHEKAFGAMSAFNAIEDAALLRKYKLSGSLNVDDLRQALVDSDMPAFQAISESHPQLITERTDYGWSLLHLSVTLNLRAFVKVILSHSTCNKAYVNGIGPDGLTENDLPHASSIKEGTALHYACLTGNFGIIEDLLKAGADWMKKDQAGRLPIYFLVGAEEGPERERFKDLCEKHGPAININAEDSSGHPDQDYTGKQVTDDVDMSGSDSSEENEMERIDSESLGRDTPMVQDEPVPMEANKMGSNVLMERNAAVNLEVTNMRSLEEVFGEKIIGQRGPIRSVASAIRRRENGWVDPDRPLVLLFLGSSGIGKTELAKQVAMYNHKKNSGKEMQLSIEMIEKENDFIRLDMSEYQEDHTVSGLFGSPKGYVGYEDGGSLACRLKNNPKAVVLLDEIEKAHPDVLTVFLQVFGDGRITDTKEGVVYCQNAIFIMTSNAASDEIKEKSSTLRALADMSADRPQEYSRFLRGFNQEIYPTLKKQFRRDEFLGRINQTIVFLPLNNIEIHQVINNELNTWRCRAAEKHGIHLSWSFEVVQMLGGAYDLNFGVRSVINEVNNVAVELVADAQICGDLRKDFLAHLYLGADKHVMLKGMDPKSEVRQKRGCRFVAL